MSDSIDEESILDTAIERVLARYRAVLPPNMLESFRWSLHFGASNHPVAQDIVRQLRPHTKLRRSGTMATGGLLDTEELEGMEVIEEIPRSGSER